MEARLQKRVAEALARNPRFCPSCTTQLSLDRCDIRGVPEPMPDGNLKVAFAYWLADCPTCLRQTERETWCAAQLTAWRLEDKANFDFQWATRFKSGDDGLLQLGIIYEFARESTFLRHLLAVCLAHDEYDLPRGRRRLNLPWLQAGQRWEETGRHSWRRAFQGVDEQQAETRLGGVWAPLRTLDLELVGNLPFATVSDARRREALRNWKLPLPTSFWHWQSLDAELEARRSMAIGRETLNASLAVRQDEQFPQRRPRSSASERKRDKARLIQLEENDGVEDICLRFNWNAGDKELKELFKGFLTANRPRKEPSSPSSSRLAKLGLLDSLAAMRLSKLSATSEAAFLSYKDITLLPCGVPAGEAFFHAGNWSKKLSNAKEFFRRTFKFGDENPTNWPERKAPQRVVR